MTAAAAEVIAVARSVAAFVVVEGCVAESFVVAVVEDEFAAFGTDLECYPLVASALTVLRANCPVPLSFSPVSCYQTNCVDPAS